MAFLAAHCITFSLYMWWFLEPSLGLEQPLPSSKILPRPWSEHLKTYKPVTFQNSCFPNLQLYGIYYQEGEPCSPPFTCTHYKNKLLNSRWRAANSQRLQQWSSHPPGDDLPWFTSLSWTESATNHWQRLHCPEFNLPSRIRISIWIETLKVGYITSVPGQVPFVLLNTISKRTTEHLFVQGWRKESSQEQPQPSGLTDAL